MLRSLLILILSFFLTTELIAQTGYLFVKKGIKKVLTLGPGDPIHLKMKDGNFVRGHINGFHNDTIYITGKIVDAKQVSQVILPERPKKRLPDKKTMLLIAAGAGLTATGLTLSKQQEFGQALVTGAAIGFGPLFLKHYGLKLLRLFIKKKYNIGRKYRLQVLDLSIPGINF